MRIFVSYSFRPENQWIESHVIPLIECFGHEVRTGQILDAEPIPEEVKNLIRGSRRVLCFVTRANPRHDSSGSIVSYEPPDWVRDELMMARGTTREAIEFREDRVVYGGAAGFVAWHPFDRDRLPDLMLRLGKLLRDWPVGPLQLKLAVPAELQQEIEQAANARTLKVRCIALDEAGTEISSEELQVRMRDDQLIVPFWIKADPKMSIEIEVDLGAKRLACRGISPSVREARLKTL